MNGHVSPIIIKMKLFCSGDEITVKYPPLAYLKSLFSQVSID